MKECAFLSNNRDGMIEKYQMMHFLNVTDVLTNRVNCSGSTFNLTLFLKSCARLARPIAVSTPEYQNRFGSGFTSISMMLTVKNDFDADPFNRD